MGEVFSSNLIKDYNYYSKNECTLQKERKTEQVKVTKGKNKKDIKNRKKKERKIRIRKISFLSVFGPSESYPEVYTSRSHRF